MDNNELKHYGVRGMRWGIRRGSRGLEKATSQKKYDKSLATLDKHRAKSVKKITKLESKHPKLERKVDKYVTKQDFKAAKLERKAYRRLTTAYKSQKRLLKANRIKSRSAEAKAKIAKNERLQELYKQGVKDIDSTIKEKGRKYVGV